MKDEGREKQIKRVYDLRVYKIAFEAAIEIFEISKKFPQEERYSLTDQVRRSSRSVCANLAEAWHKRRYLPMFINKLTDCMSESSETQVWLEFANKCKYVDSEIYKQLDERYEHIIAMLKAMESKAEKFCS